MKNPKIPQIDPIEELARFWDTHDLTDFETELEEVTEPVFERETMDKAAFIQTKGFIFSDIEREMQIARADTVQLGRLGITPGDGNFLAALGLLCYTEFGGKLRFNRKRGDGTDIASENFNLFFDEIGPAYQSFGKQHDVFDIYRCGLAHEYYVKKSCTIYMFGDQDAPGIGIDDSGKYWFVVENYCRDLKHAFDKLEQYLFGGEPSA